MDSPAANQDGASARPRSLVVQLYDGLISGFAVIAGLMIVAAMLIVCADVGLRLVSRLSLPWSFEVTEFFLVYVPLLTMPWLVRRRQHIVIDIFTSWLNPDVARRLRIFVLLLSAAICIFVAYWGVLATLTAYNRGIINAGLVSFPRWALLFVIPLGFGTAAIEFARGAWRDLLGRGPSGDESNSVSAA